MYPHRTSWVVCAALLAAGCNSIFVPKVTPEKPLAAPKNPVSGNACKSNDDCIAGEACNAAVSKCQKECGADVDCPAGDHCADNDLCTANTPCASNTDCADGLYCKKLACVSMGACATNDDCRGGYACVDRQCLKAGPGSACTAPGDCNGAIECVGDQCDCKDSVCSPKQGDACQPSQAANACAKGQFCTPGGVCAPAVACLRAADCQNGGLACRDGYCKNPLPCAADGLCSSGFVCEHGACLVSDAGKLCGADSDCGAGFFCKAAAQPANSACAAGCKADPDCSDGRLCDTNTHLCGQTQVPPGLQGCQTSDDCNRGCAAAGTLSTQVCDQGGGYVCRPRCTDDNSCSEGGKCTAVYVYEIPTGDACNLAPLGGYSVCR